MHSLMLHNPRPYVDNPDSLRERLRNRAPLLFVTDPDKVLLEVLNYRGNDMVADYQQYF